MTDTTLEVATRLGELASKYSVTVTAAESCTGGGVASAITHVPGASGWFEYGFVTYSNGAKSRLLGVKPQTLLQYGAVSAEVVTAMAKGACEKSGADYAVAISGIAGPGGSTPTKPVGLVWFAWGPAKGAMKAEHRIFSGDRTQVREQAVVFALNKLCEAVENNTV